MTGAAHGVISGTAMAASQHLSDLLPPGSTMSPLRVIGTDAYLAHRVDLAEHDRRTSAGLDAVETSDQLELLMSLPIGMPVPVASLSLREQRHLRRLPPGAVEIVDDEVIRAAVTPIHIDIAVVPAPNWRAGLEHAGRFAPFTTRMMWLRRKPADLDHLSFEAQRFGVGVMIGWHDDPDILLAPAPYVRRRFTAAGWLFTEQVYRQLFRSRGPRPS